MRIVHTSLDGVKASILGGQIGHERLVAIWVAVKTIVDISVTEGDAPVFREWLISQNVIKITGNFGDLVFVADEQHSSNVSNSCWLAHLNGKPIEIAITDSKELNGSTMLSLLSIAPTGLYRS